MKTLILTILLALVLFTIQTYSSDSLKIGKKYKVVTTNYWETTGILISQDSSSILIRKDKTVYTIKKDQVKAILRPDQDYNESITNWNEGSDSIINNSDGEYIIILTSGKKIKNCLIKKILSDTITLEKNYEEIKVNVENIKKITAINPSYMAVSIIGGAFTGGITGALIGRGSEPEAHPEIPFGNIVLFRGLPTFIGGAIGVLLGGLTGGVIGSIISADDDYDLSKLTKQQKINNIKNIIQ